jgi:hypothetical protein
MFLVDANSKESKEWWNKFQQVSTEAIDGMGGVTNERHVEARVMGQQVNVENVVPLVPSEIIEEEQVEVNEIVGETFKRNADKIEMDLERTISMIEDQENVVFANPLLEQRNANDDVEPHAHIDGGDIAMEFHFLLLPHPSFQVERMGGVFLGQICDCNTFFDCGF